MEINSQIFHEIRAQQSTLGFSKHEQLVNGIINAIDAKILSKGDPLPSVNVMVGELGFARKTIVKAYNELKDRGLVASKNRLGYYISNETTSQELKIALVLYAFQAFQEKFYNTFREEMGDKVHFDVYFHHNNVEFLESILTNIKGRYGMYVIAPIPDIRLKEAILQLPPEKVIIVDRYLDFCPDISFVSQQFYQPFYDTLNSLTSSFKRFDSIVFFFRPNSDNPQGLYDAFIDYMETQSFPHQVMDNYQSGAIQKGTVYITLGDSDLWEILKDCKEQHLKVGTDIGILSNNDNSIKEIIFDGITTFSTDFEKMALEAAAFVKNRKTTKRFIPSVLIRRASL